ncbi:von Willebrand factor type A domain-containing protein [Roseibacillus persicicus]|uniref:vWA domain-containing protein n=1 Tax=Roseibacillus persicicus TaxID=454148 RepID=UPI00398B8B40
MNFQRLPLVALLFATSCSQNGTTGGYTPASVPAPASVAPAPSITVGGTITSGLRSGDYAVSGNSIDAILNNPNRHGGDFIGSVGVPLGSPERGSYPKIQENPFIQANKESTSTFSVDVDTSSYSNLRNFVKRKQVPPADAIRIEEMVNYFDYNYPLPKGDAPFAIAAEVAACPWQANNRIALIGLRAAEVPAIERPPANLVFLLDISGSMDNPNKLPLLKKSFRLLLDQLDDRDRVAIVTYAGDDRVALKSTSCSERNKILRTLDDLEAAGSTNGEGGLKRAYRIARSEFSPEKINRIILATDGDFNVGLSDQDELKTFIKKEAQSGIYLTALGFGMSNHRDDTMQTLAQNGNGQAAYIDSLLEAKKVLVTELGATLQTVAKDVKIQVVFDPTKVKSYRLIGYETRLLTNADFSNDRKDAGEMGAGHRVTALYEIEPREQATGKLFTLKIRHKAPKSTRSQLQTVPIVDTGKTFREASGEFQFASSVAAFGMLLRDSGHKGNTTRENVLQWARPGLNYDPNGMRKEFISLVKKAKLSQLKRASS